MRIDNNGSDCQFKFSPVGQIELVFSTEHDVTLLTEYATLVARAEGLFFRKPRPNKVTFNKIIAGIMKPIPVSIEISGSASHESTVTIGATYRPTDGGSIGRVLQAIKELKMLLTLALNAKVAGNVLKAGAAVEKIAADPRSSHILLKFLSTHADPEIRIAVADNPFAPVQALTLLANDDNADVRYAVAENHNVTLPVLNQLANDSNPYVACRAQRTIERVTMPKSALMSAPSMVPNAVRNMMPQMALAMV